MGYAFVFLLIIFSVFEDIKIKIAAEVQCEVTTKKTTKIPSDSDNLILRRRDIIPLHEFHAIDPPPVFRRRMSGDDDLNYRKTRNIENNVEPPPDSEHSMDILHQKIQESMMQDQHLKQKQALQKEREKRNDLLKERKKILDNFRRELRWLHTVYNDGEDADDNNEIR